MPALGLTILGLGSIASQAQQDSFTYRADVVEAKLWFAVQDRAAAPLLHLDAGQLTVVDGNQRISQFSHFSQVDNAPVRVHFVIDVSGSDQRSLGMVREAMSQSSIAYSRPGDAIRITAFSDHAVSAQIRSREDAEAFWKAAARLIGKPVTALYDNLYPTLAAADDVDAVVLISDGDDNFSATYSVFDIFAAARQCPARVFTLGVEMKRHPLSQEFLQRMAQAGGGSAMQVQKLSEASAALTAIAQGLRTYYTISFPIPEQQRDGRFHPVTLKIADKRVARIQSKPGYFAPPADRTLMMTAAVSPVR